MFSDSVEMSEYRELPVIQRFVHTALDFGTIEHVEACFEAENYRAMRYRTPKMEKWHDDRFIYVHPTIGNERAIEIIDDLCHKHPKQ